MPILKNKVAIVTGAGSGIGKEVAFIYASEGAKVVVADIVEAGGIAVADEINARGGAAFFVKADTSSPSDSKSLVKKAIERYGALHIACNNAGIGGPIVPVGEYPVEGWDKVIGVNLSGVFYGMRYQIPEILKAGGGAIINMASILGQVGTKGAAAYVAAKHGVVGLTQTAALEYGSQNIRINAVGPGYIETPLLTNTLDAATMAGLASLHPIGRIGQPQEVAELVLWLSSDKASFVSGSYYNIDGGYLAQ